MKKVRVFVAEHCEPCIPVKELIENGKIDAEVELIDIESEEGFKYIEKLNIDGVPSAYQGSERCQMRVDEENQTLNILCPNKEEKENEDKSS